MTLAEALGNAEGMNQDVAVRRGFLLFVQRKTSRMAKSPYLSAECEGRIGNDTRNGIPAEPYDIVYVTTAPLARWNRVILCWYRRFPGCTT